MRRYIQLFVAAFIILTLGMPAIAMGQGRSPGQLSQLRDSLRAVNGRVIIVLKSTDPARPALRGRAPLGDAELQSVESRLKVQHGLRMRGHAPMIGAVFGDIDDARVAELNADPNVQSIEADRFMALQSTRDGIAISRDATRTQDLPWGISQVTAPQAWALGFRGDGVKVGMMDTGGDPTHPDLTWAGGFNGNTGGTSPSDWTDDIPSCNGHGTHTAGTVAARDNGVGVVGVAPNVSLYALKVFVDIGGTCGAWVSAQITALQWAVSQGIRVVNASLGGSAGGSYLLALQSAADAGTFMVAAAGNDYGGAVEYPAAFPTVIAVSSLSSSNTVSSFSSVGPQVWVGAPGENVESTLPGGGYGYKSGTSMATPHVTGVVALILQQTPNLTLAQVRQKLQNGALDIDAPGFDNNTGWGLVRAANSLGGGGGGTPVALAVSPFARSVSVVQGASAPSDNASVTLTGTNAASVAWSASNRKSWNTLTTASGTGSGSVAWSRNASGLAVGTYIDTITVVAGGAASGTPSTVFDTLKITAASIPVTLAVAPAARSVAAVQGANAPADNATVTLSGTNAASTTWTATKKQSWTTLTTAGGTGSGTVAWSRNATGLAVGTYVDTITVTAPGAASGSPSTVFDTLRITAAVIPVAMAVAPGARSVSVVQGASAPADNAAVTLTGTNAGSTAWSASNKKSWNTFTVASGTGSGTVAWSRNATGLAAGTYVDTITVTSPGAATGSPSTVFDTLRITAASIPVALAVTPGSRNASAQQGSSAPNDNASVTLSGTNAASTAWTATKKKSWTTLTTASGTGSGTVAWSRNAGGLAVGTYVDTITVTAPGAASGSPSMVIDTLQVTATPIPVALAVTPGARSVSVQAGASAPGDNASVTLTGTNAGSTAWSASNRKSWNTLTISSGTGSGTVAWNRNATGLAAGTYVDTITVTASGAAGGSPSTVYDTLRITAAPIAIALAVSPAARSVSISQGASAPGDDATVTLSGTNAGSTSWSANHRKSWNTLTTASGTGSGTLTWTRNTASLAVGTYVDTITVTAPGAASGSPATVFDTVRITQVIATHPGGKKTRQLSNGPGHGASVLEVAVDSVVVENVGDNQPGDVWIATTTASRLQIVTPQGTVGGAMVWQRLSIPVPAGLYVDTIHVSLQRDPASEILFTDTLEVVTVAAPTPAAAVEDLFHNVNLTDDQRMILDRQGNNNGRYDIGDFLAWVDREHVQLTAALVARLNQLPAKQGTTHR